MTSTPAQLQLRRSKAAERKWGKWLLDHDGPDIGAYAPGHGIVTKTGRVGHITALQYDLHSLTYAGECKHVKVPVKMLRWWVQILERAEDQRKEPLLIIDPSNEPDSYVHSGYSHKIPALHIITADRHAELLRCEQISRQITESQTESA